MGRRDFALRLRSVRNLHSCLAGRQSSAPPASVAPWLLHQRNRPFERREGRSFRSGLQSRDATGHRQSKEAARLLDRDRLARTHRPKFQFLCWRSSGQRKQSRAAGQAVSSLPAASTRCGLYGCRDVCDFPPRFSKQNLSCTSANRPGARRFARADDASSTRGACSCGWSGQLVSGKISRARSHPVTRSASERCRPI